MKRPQSIQEISNIAVSIKNEIAKALIGQEDIVEKVLIALFSSGHVLIEGLPGLGKTLLIKALTKTFKGNSARIQFTPDLMPADITGHVMYDVQKGKFETRRGPIFTNLLIADEINRAPAKTQAALLEVMQERQVSLDGISHELERPFLTMATQNPLEHEGTYPLPDAQLDRFLLKIHIKYPKIDEEIQMVEYITNNHIGDNFMLENVNEVADINIITHIQEMTTSIIVDRRVIDYAVRIVNATRNWPGISVGAGPRGSLALIRASRALALLNGRDFITPDDVKELVLPALRHRISLSPEVEIEGHSSDDILPQLLQTIDVPRI